MNILITGGAGFIGSHLCAKLNEEGHKLTVIDNLNSQVHGSIPSESESYKKISKFVKFIKGSVEKESTWNKLKEKDFDVIICLASETGTGQSMMEAKNYCQSNITSIALLNDLVVKEKIKCKKIILSSSRSVYGDSKLDESGNPVATKESDDINPKSIYAVTKLAQEKLLLTGFGKTDVCILRFQNVYGPGQSLKNPYTGIISIFSTAIRNGDNIQIFSDGLMTRDFVYISDVVDAIILSIKKGLNGEIYNVGSGIPTTVIGVASVLKKLYNSDVKIDITGEDLSGDIRNNFADISKMEKIGYKPKYSFEEGIKNFVDWSKNQKVLKNNLYSSSLEEFRKKGLLK